MKTYNQFSYDKYIFSHDDHTLKLFYSFDEELHFCETYTFGFEFAQNIDSEALARACELLLLVAGVSYYKAFPSEKLHTGDIQIDPVLAKYLEKTHKKGLGEFFYVNNLDPNPNIHFPTNSEKIAPLHNPKTNGLLVGLGGGKDSLVSVELLRTSNQRIATWSLGHRPQLEPLVEKVGLPHFWIDRTIDPQIIELNKNEARNGHIPISAIFSCVGTVLAVLSGYKDVVVSNEASASEPNLEYMGVQINHQYSKSLEYETSYQEVLASLFVDSIRYYSSLRPFSELKIAEIFASVAFNKYKGVFSSCNRAFTQTSNSLSWCGECAKCAFTFLILTPFIERKELENVFGGKNLLLDPTLGKIYNQLLGISGDKPLDCVGEIKESRSAMQLAFRVYPELHRKYSFDIPEDYDYKLLQPHSMPDEINSIVVDHTEQY